MAEAAHHVKELVLRPSKDHVLVKEDPFKYEGMIEIPDKAKRRPTTGIIVARGKNINEEWSIGEHVLYAQFSGTGIQLKNQPAYRVLTETELLLHIDPSVEVELVSA
jgi:co-chaperonin GroES (HSP10)